MRHLQGGTAARGGTGATTRRWGTSLCPRNQGRLERNTARRLVQVKVEVTHTKSGEGRNLFGRWESPKPVHFFAL